MEMEKETVIKLLRDMYSHAVGHINYLAYHGKKDTFEELKGYYIEAIEQVESLDFNQKEKNRRNNG